MKLLQYVFPSLPLYFRAFRLLISNESSYLHSTGWMASLAAQRPLGNEGQALPWMNYAVIHFLQGRLRKDHQLFEFGSGYSTFFYAQRVQSVTSVEYDKTWYDIIKDQAPANVEMIYQEKDVAGAYCATILNSGRLYDIVIVDGRDRANCIERSIGALTARGVILLDDSQREKYAEGIRYAVSKGFRRLDFEGLKPTGFRAVMSTLLYRPDNCLGL